MSDFRWHWLDLVEHEDSPVSPGGRHVANVLVRHFVRSGEDVCWPGTRKLARILGVSKTTAGVYLDNLVAAGFLERTKRANGSSYLSRLVEPDKSVFTGTPVRTVRPRGGRGTGTPSGTVSGWLEKRKAVRPEGHTVPVGLPEPLLVPLNRREEGTGHAREPRAVGPDEIPWDTAA